MMEYGRQYGIPVISLQSQQLTTRGIMANKWNLDLQFNVPNNGGVTVRQCIDQVIELKLQMLREYTDAMLAINRAMKK